jgi:hypothetical protein
VSHLAGKFLLAPYPPFWMAGLARQAQDVIMR